MPDLCGIAASVAAAALLGPAVGIFVRHVAGADTAVTGLLLLPSPLGPLFGDAQHCGAGVPRRALCCSSQTTDAIVRTAGSLGPVTSLLRVAGYTAEPPLAAGALRTRDG
ncbi:hypothetical protein [Streptomyces umbrinus]|uniref:hypothetical protein n=1 Tax=Streptomyces umbrinus TaxID=67370 RepID=UPI0033C8814A